MLTLPVRYLQRKVCDSSSRGSRSRAFRCRRVPASHLIPFWIFSNYFLPSLAILKAIYVRVTPCQRLHGLSLLRESSICLTVTVSATESRNRGVSMLPLDERVRAREGSALLMEYSRKDCATHACSSLAGRVLCFMASFDRTQRITISLASADSLLWLFLVMESSFIYFSVDLLSVDSQYSVNVAARRTSALCSRE